MFGQQLAFRHFFFATGTSGHTKVSKENTDFIKYSYFMYLHKSCNRKNNIYLCSTFKYKVYNVL